jgi:hypothetical protein
MKNEFVPYELALKLKQLGFDEPCFLYWWKNESGYILADIIYDEVRTLDFKAPLFQQAFRWFRERYGLNYVIVKAESWFYTINGCNTQEGFNTYEEAELACLDKLIEILEPKQQEQ